MDKYKHQAIAVGITLFIGFLLGVLLTHNRIKDAYEEREKALLEQQKIEIEAYVNAALGRISYYKDKADSLEQVIKHRGDSILVLENKVKINDKNTLERLKEAAKLNKDEKVLYLRNRYDSIASP